MNKPLDIRSALCSINVNISTTVHITKSCLLLYRILCSLNVCILLEVSDFHVISVHINDITCTY